MKKTVCVIDDESIINEIVKEFLSQEYNVLTYTSGHDFLHNIETDQPNIIICDIMMPEIDGYEILDRLRSYRDFKNVPVVFLTSRSQSIDEIKALNHGAIDFIIKPFSPEVLRIRLKLHLELSEAKKKLENQNNFLNQEVEKSNTQYRIVQQLSFHSLAQIIDFRDSETGNHILRTKLYVKSILNELAKTKAYHDVLDKKKIADITEASVFHDIGKVVIPDYILRKTSKLNEIEWDIMKSHVTKGKEAIDRALDLIEQLEDEERKQIDDILAFFKTVQNVVLYHHEKYDGTGYPYQLKGSDIPLEARVMAVADVFDALLSKRPYKEAWNFEESMQYIVDLQDKHFDPEVVKAFIKAKIELKNVYNQYLLNLI